MTLSKDNKPLYQRGWLAAKQATNNASIQNGCPAGTIEFSSRFDGASEIAAKTVCVCVCVCCPPSFRGPPGPPFAEIGICKSRPPGNPEGPRDYPLSR